MTAAPVLRTVRPEDAPALLALRHQLDIETAFMLLEPGERVTTEEQTRQMLERLLQAGNCTLILAESDEKLVGYLSAQGGEFLRNRRTAYLVIGILQAYAGQGLGTRLMAEAERWARERGLHRLELTVMAHNSRAVALYRKAGFDIEGTKRQNLFVNGVYIDEYLMSKLLGD
jgi:RimJ/RimL family protein N-acetyltransferase